MHSNNENNCAQWGTPGKVSCRATFTRLHALYNNGNQLAAIWKMYLLDFFGLCQIRYRSAHAYCVDAVRFPIIKKIALRFHWTTSQLNEYKFRHFQHLVVAGQRVRMVGVWRTLPTNKMYARISLALESRCRTSCLTGTYNVLKLNVMDAILSKLIFTSDVTITICQLS